MASKLALSTQVFGWSLILAIVSSCATSQKTDVADDEKMAPGPAFYVLREGEKIDNPSPLPHQTKILVDWTYSDGAKRSKVQFKGWDVNRDGRFDMVEVLDHAGKAVGWAYDFNGDSVVDAVEHATKANDLPGNIVAPQVSH